MDLTTLAGVRTYVETVVYKGAQRIMEEDGNHWPLAFIFATQVPGLPEPLGGVHVCPFPFAVLQAQYGLTFDERGKEAYARAIQALARETKAVAVVFVCEAWAARYKADGLEAPPPSEAPNREEVISVALDHRDGRTFCKAPIIRDGDAVALGGLEWDDGDAKTFGRFSNLLGRPEPPEPRA